jgi:hypothetical protein
MLKSAIAAALALLFTMPAAAQGTQGVRPDAGPLQIGIGYTFLSFNEVPSKLINSSGFTASAAYYRDWIGAEAQLSDAFGSQNGKTSQLLFTGGGVRLRWPNARSIQPWVHGIVGYSRLSPQTAFGGSSAVGYKVGAGLDFNPRHSRIGYRVSADMFGSSFFGTYQLSPELSAGIVLALGRE